MTQVVTDRISGAQGALTSQRATLATACGMIDRRMAYRTWVAGQHFSMADCAAAPALFYASTLQPIPGEFSHLSADFDRLTGWPSFNGVIEEARPYFSLYQFCGRDSEAISVGGGTQCWTGIAQRRPCAAAKKIYCFPGGTNAGSR